VFAAHVASRTIGGMSQSGTGIHLHGAAVEQDVGRGLDPGIASTHLKDRDGYIVYPHRSILRAPSQPTATAPVQQIRVDALQHIR
jgi:hypothetical protein